MERTMKTFITLVALIGLVGCGPEETQDTCSVEDECVPEVVEEFCGAVPEPGSVCLEQERLQQIRDHERHRGWEEGYAAGIESVECEDCETCEVCEVCVDRYDEGYAAGLEAKECPDWQDGYDNGYRAGSLGLQYCQNQFDRLLTNYQGVEAELWDCSCQSDYVPGINCEGGQ